MCLSEIEASDSDGDSDDDEESIMCFMPMTSGVTKDVLIYMIVLVLM